MMAAIALLTALLVTVQEHSGEEWIRIGNSYFQRNQLDQAADAYQNALRVQPEHPDALYNLALVFGRREDYRSASRHLEKLLAKNSANAEAIVLLCQAKLRLNELPSALRCVTSFLELSRSDPATNLALAQILAEYQLYQEAVEVLDKARVAHPDSPQILLALGSLAHLNGQFDLAQQTLHKVTREYPDQQQAWLTLAYSYYQSGKFGDAKTTFVECVRRFPSNPTGHYYLAVIETRLGGDPTPIRQRLEHVLQLDPQHAFAYYQLGRLSLQEGQLEKAADLLEASLRLNGQNPEACYLLSQTYGRLGKESEAARFQNLGDQLKADASLRRLEFNYFPDSTWIDVSARKN